MAIFQQKKHSEDFVDIQDYNKSKMQVKIITFNTPEDHETVIKALAADAISVVNLKPLLKSDKEAVKNSIQKIKRICRTLEADLAAFSEDLMVVVPKGVEIYKHD
jgi:SepF-like predicted cell division protein (DUF552 family)